MNKRRHTKLVREGPYAAEVDVELIEAGDGRLDAVRETLRRGDIQAASQYVRVFTLTPVSR